MGLLGFLFVCRNNAVTTHPVHMLGISMIIPKGFIYLNSFTFTRFFSGSVAASEGVCFVE